jgi:hypothetical protein
MQDAGGSRTTLRCRVELDRHLCLRACVTALAKTRSRAAKMESWVSRAGATFKGLDWFVSPYMQGGVIRKLAAAIDPAPESHAILEVELRRLYGLEHLASMLLERYRKVNLVGDFAEQIGEAIEAHALGLDHPAVSTLLPVIEGKGWAYSLTRIAAGSAWLRSVAARISDRGRPRLRTGAPFSPPRRAPDMRQRGFEQAR